MQKIPTIFVRDETRKGHPVTDQVKPECQWVLDGEGEATVKLDGTNVKIQDGELLKRQKPKERDYDDAAYVPCRRSDPSDKWAFEAFDLGISQGGLLDGVYELIGPKIQGNPHNSPIHKIVRVAPVTDNLRVDDYSVVRTFAGLRHYMSQPDFKWEGLVFHHMDGRKAKIKRRDYGLAWPASSQGDRQEP